MTELKVKIEKNNIFRFLLYHNWCSFSGLLFLIIGVGSLVLAVWQITESKWKAAALLGLIAFLILVYQPISLYMRAAKQQKNNPAFQEMIVYRFTDAGMTVEIGAEEAAVTWEEITKVVVMKHLIMVYCGPVRANLIPTDGQEAARTQLIALAKQKLSRYQLKRAIF